MKQLHANSETALKPSLGDRIKRIRLAWKWSQEEMASVLNVDQASISFWERDKVAPSGSALVALASLFRMRIEALREAKDFKVPESPSDQGSTRLDRKPPRSISLPCGRGDNVMVVDLADGSSLGQQVSEAVMNLSEGFKANRLVWIVLE